MMDLFTAIQSRYSYRGEFTGEKVPREDLRKIVEAGLAAPSGRNGQTTRFIIVDNEQVLASIREMHASNQAMQTASAFIVCLVDRVPEPIYEGLSFQVEDCAAAVENMLLAISALGYASVWVDGWLRIQDRADKVGQLLGIPPKKVARILLPIGIPIGEGDRKEKLPFEQRAWFNQYGE